MKIALLLAAGAAMIYFALRWLEQRSLYFPDRQLIATPHVFGMVYEDVMLKTSDGARVNAWFLPGEGPNPRVILFCHGNAGNISHRLDKAHLLKPLGVGLLFFDYRGYGHSAGWPSEQGTYRDAEAAYHYLSEMKKIPSSQIILYGESLGCAVAVEMARRHPAAGLMLESPFTSTVAMAKLIFPWLPSQWTIRNKYDNLSKIAEIRVPLLILHSPHDEIIPFAMGQALYQAAPPPKTFFALTGGHNDGYIETGSGYAQAIGKFLKSLHV